MRACMLAHMYHSTCVGQKTSSLPLLCGSASSSDLLAGTFTCRAILADPWLLFRLCFQYLIYTLNLEPLTTFAPKQPAAGSLEDGILANF